MTFQDGFQCHQKSANVSLWSLTAPKKEQTAWSYQELKGASQFSLVVTQLVLLVAFWDEAQEIWLPIGGDDYPGCCSQSL